MKQLGLFCLLFILIACQPSERADRGQYLNNHAPLRLNPYIELPLGNIKAEGWLKEMLLTQKNGLTGRLDELYPLVMGKTNGWLGGDGDQWERGPYWIDGLLPLAYILEDKELIEKTKPWIEWTLNSQKEDGYFGPREDYENNIPGVQRDNAEDWWPKMVMLKVLQQYSSATGDERVIRLMTNYFKYQLKELPGKPLDNWTFWARYRGGDNLMSVYWLYNITQDEFLLDLAEIIYKQTFDFANTFMQDYWWRTGNMHCVNLSQGLKTPAIYYQRHPEEKYLAALKKGMNDIVNHLGYPVGAYGGDETLHGNNPTQGTELCTIVEFMFSLEKIFQITGDTYYADYLEKLAYNALPTQISDDYMSRQYFQQANQVMISRHRRNFDTDHDGTDVCFGMLTGYPCCTSNMHQGWPKFVQNLWYATNDGGLAAVIYAPSSVKAKVASGTEISIREETAFPFDDVISFHISTPETATFPLQLRIPSWTVNPELTVNGQNINITSVDSIITINRKWENGDVVMLHLPSDIRLSEWHERSVAVQRGPLVYALKMNEYWEKKENKTTPVWHGTEYFDVKSDSPWNYALIDCTPENMAGQYHFSDNGNRTAYPWNQENNPFEIKTKAVRMSSWGLYNEMAGPLPYSISYNMERNSPEEEITLIPYGCTTLRITEFPMTRP
ncbi:MAG: glycoside hydrolase family 127 protein [Prevotella sp.]|jgi:DUF1680 family protein|nr:glycoside hydrolase family 127 protein [Prevotella sp.]